MTAQAQKLLARIRNFQPTKREQTVDSYVEVRSQAVTALRSIIEAHQALEDALDVGEVIVERLNDLDAGIFRSEGHAP